MKPYSVPISKSHLPTHELHTAVRILEGLVQDDYGNIDTSGLSDILDGLNRLLEDLDCDKAIDTTYDPIYSDGFLAVFLCIHGAIAQMLDLHGTEEITD